MKRLLSVLSVCILISSCATHNGIISSSSGGRFVRYEDIAYGVSQSNNYFGIGGLSQDAMVLEAKRVLMKSRPLSGNEGYTNFTVDTKRFTFLFYTQTKVTVAADVVHFVTDTLADAFSDKYKTKLLGGIFSNPLFDVGDSIVGSDNINGTVLSYKNKDVINILYKTSKDKFRTKYVSIFEIYSISKKYKGYKVGDTYLYNTIKYGMAEQYKGTIIGLGINMLLLKDINGNIRLVEYSN